MSPILFNIMNNDIFVNLGYGVGCALYADDGAIWKRSKCNPRDFKYANSY